MESRRLRRWSACALLASCASAVAAPGYYVVTVYDNESVARIETRYWTVDRPRRPVVEWPEIGVGYGVTSRWTTFVYASFIGSSQMATELETLNWQNDFLLTQGELRFDLALHTNIARKRNEPDGHVFEFGPALQTDVGRTQLNLNLLFERARIEGERMPTELKYQWQVRHRWHPLLNPGLQGFGEVGRWNDWLPHDGQSHRAGPALFGTAYLADGGDLGYQAAILLGNVGGRTARMLSLRMYLTF